MTKNMRTIDRIVRAIVGMILIALAATRLVPQWGWLGLIPILTALIGWCPVYTLLGVSTLRPKA
jgi:hypothetical protein